MIGFSITFYNNVVHTSNIIPLYVFLFHMYFICIIVGKRGVGPWGKGSSTQIRCRYCVRLYVDKYFPKASNARPVYCGHLRMYTLTSRVVQPICVLYLHIGVYTATTIEYLQYNNITSKYETESKYWPRDDCHFETNRVIS